MIRQFRLVLLDVCERAIEPLLFSREQDKPDGPPWFHPAAHDRIRSSERATGTHSIVCRPLGKIPRIQMSADNQHLLRIFAPANFAHDVGALNRTAGKSILHVEVYSRGQSTRDV